MEVEIHALVYQFQSQVRHHPVLEAISFNLIETAVPGGFEKVGCEGIIDMELFPFVPEVQEHTLGDILGFGLTYKQRSVCGQSRIVSKVKNTIGVSAIFILHQRG